MQESTGKAALIRRDGSALLDQILDTPGIAEVVPRLPPDTLHRVIDRCGLESCGALMVLATPAQVARVFDLDLWRRPEAGLDQQFDAERFGVWLEVLVEQGAEVAARLIARLDVGLVAAGLSQHVRVFDIATLEAYVTSDGTDVPAVIERDGGLGSDLAGRRLIPRRQDAWDAILDVLAALHELDPDAFARLMHACTTLSHSRPEIDGLDELLGQGRQSLFDLADARAQRLEAQGFATPAEARAFLESSRRLGLARGSRPPAVSIAHGEASPPAARAGDEPEPQDVEAPREAVTAVVDLLLDAGLVGAPGPRALLTAAPEDAPRFRLLQAQLRGVFARDPAAASTRQAELAWLANALMAGGTVDARAFTAQEASDAVAATCNLGLEYWPPAWRDGAALSDHFLVGQDLVTVFQVGWTVLHDDVCASAVSALLGALDTLPRHDAETEAGLQVLRRELTKHGRAGTAWQAREALDILATLDLPAWATLLALIAECPVALATIDTGDRPRPRRFDPSAFVFIAERAQVAAVHVFLDSLPNMLSP
jgi:hypothetical protein